MPDRTTPHIEKAARAIFDSAPGTFARWDDLAPYAQENYYNHARAALSTTLEPSEAEIRAAFEKIIGVSAVLLKYEDIREAVRTALIAAARVRVGE